jgi:GNAT superfamily N-acetyltransferase
MLTPERAVQAIEEIFVECFHSLAALRGGQKIDEHGAIGVITNATATFFNGIGATQFSGDIDDRVEQTIEIFRQRGRAFRWWISPSTQPRGLPDVFAAHEIKYVYDSGGMAADLGDMAASPLPHGLTVEEVTDHSRLQEWTDVLATVFNIPDAAAAAWFDSYAELAGIPRSPWTQFVAYVDGRPVATSSLLVAGPLAGIYHVGTVADARGRGIGAAITLEAMRAGRDAGASIAVLQSSDMGSPVYRSIGFREYCRLSMYDWRPFS